MCVGTENGEALCLPKILARFFLICRKQIQNHPQTVDIDTWRAIERISREMWNSVRCLAKELLCMEHINMHTMYCIVRSK